MLLGSASKRPNLETVRQIKKALRAALKLSDDATITVTQLACLEEDCAPLETVVGLLRAGMPQLQHKLHKATDAIQPEDLVEICVAWGFHVHPSDLEPFPRSCR